MSTTRSRAGLFPGLLLCVTSFGGSAFAQFPTLLVDLRPGSSSSRPDSFQDWNGELFFLAQTDAFGVEPWLSDGTAAGTRLLKDIHDGGNSSIAATTGGYTVEFNGHWYFVADDGIHGREVWRSDGTTAGTELFFDFQPGGFSSSPFVRSLGNQLLIQATTSAHGAELWVSDGTLAGTQLLVDFNPGPDSGVNGVFVVGNELLLSANDGVHGFEPWKSDGTAGGFQMLMDIRPGSDSSYFGNNAATWNGEVFFSANDPLKGYELFATDMTPAGTRLVADIRPGSESSGPKFIRNAKLNTGLLFLAYTDETGEEPFMTDGTEAGTFLLGDFRVGASSSQALIVDLSPEVAVFGANSTTYGYEPFLTDGTIAGTQVVDLNPGTAAGSYSTNQLWHRSGDKVYFPAQNPGTSWELGVSDGTLAGTFLIRDLVSSQTTLLGSFLVLEDYLFFGTNGFTAYSDGTTENTQLIPQDPSGPGIATVNDVLRIGDTLFFGATDELFGGEFGYELWTLEADLDGDGTLTLFDSLNLSKVCVCDAASTPPCGNVFPSAGCASSLGSGASLDGSGTTQLTKDDLVLTTTNLPASVFGLMFMGPNLHAPLPLGDGLRCVGGGLRRWPIQNTGAGGTMSNGPGLAAHVQANFPSSFHFLPGHIWNFQTWYRDVSGPCSGGSNLSNAVQISITP